MNLGDRLRTVVRVGASAAQDRSDLPHSHADFQGFLCGSDEADRSAEPGNADRIAVTLGGEWREARGQRYLVVDRQYSAGHCLGHVSVGECLPSADGLWPQLDLLLSGGRGPGAHRGRLLFIDLETTGLAGGAGTYAFLVGCGWFEGAVFRVRQFFLSSFAAERGLLEDVADTMSAAGALVTYNGKTFDVPLIETRFLFHRMAVPAGSVPHLDMLHSARLLWRASCPSREPGERQAACRLTLMERTVLGHARERDVPGFEIPARYFQYVRTGNAQPLDGVLEHNRLDLLALAMLTARAARLLEAGAAGTRTVREALGLGRIYERGGLTTEARACFARAMGTGPDRPSGPVDPLTLAEALRAYGTVCRRARQYAEAADAWRRLLALRDCPPRFAQEANDALAVHHEHRSCDLRAARQFAVRSLQLGTSAARAEAVRHRLTRIDRKLGSPPPQPAPLF